MQLFRRRANPSRKENSMKPARCFLLLCASLVLAAQARALPVPDACGDDAARFDVSMQIAQPAPTAPAAGKALLVFIEDQHNEPYDPFDYSDTVRFALDGAWIGADRGNSYFVLDVAPGLHHLCASWQGKTRGATRFDLAPVKAEPGKIYYFAAEVTDSEHYHNFSLAQLNDDQGQYRLKFWTRSTSKPHR
jgi:hypothetical protein